MSLFSLKLFNNPDIGGYVNRPSVAVRDSVSTVQPSGSHATIDGVVLGNEDKVLFTNLSDSNKNNKIYTLSGVGSSDIHWQLVVGPDSPTGIVLVGDLVFVENGNTWAEQLLGWDGSQWQSMDPAVLPVSLPTFSANKAVTTNASGILQSIGPGILPSVTKIVHVSLSGNDSTGDGSQYNPFLTVTKALTAVTITSTSIRWVIQLGPGKFFAEPGDLVIPTGVEIRGVGKAWTNLGVPSGHSLLFNTTSPSSPFSGNSIFFKSLSISGPGNINLDQSTLSNTSTFIIVEYHDCFVNAAASYTGTAGTGLIFSVLHFDTGIGGPNTISGPVDYEVIGGYLVNSLNASSNNCTSGDTPDAEFYNCALFGNISIDYSVNAPGIVGEVDLMGVSFYNAENVGGSVASLSLNAGTNQLNLIHDTISIPTSDRLTLGTGIQFCYNNELVATGFTGAVNGNTTINANIAQNPPNLFGAYYDLTATLDYSGAASSVPGFRETYTIGYQGGNRIGQEININTGGSGSNFAGTNTFSLILNNAAVSSANNIGGNGNFGLFSLVDGAPTSTGLNVGIATYTQNAPVTVGVIGFAGDVALASASYVGIHGRAKNNSGNAIGGHFTLADSGGNYIPPAITSALVADNASVSSADIAHFKSAGTTVAKIDASGNLRLSGSLGVGNSASATTPGAVVKKIEVFDQSGTSLGFLPVYSSIT